MCLEDYAVVGWWESFAHIFGPSWIHILIRKLRWIVDRGLTYLTLYIPACPDTFIHKIMNKILKFHHGQVCVSVMHTGRGWRLKLRGGLAGSRSKDFMKITALRTLRPFSSFSFECV